MKSEKSMVWDLFCTNGNIRTLDKASPNANWMLIHNECIIMLGTSPAPEFLAKRILDLKNKTVVPGFIDSHTHLSAFGIARKFWVDLGDVHSNIEAVEKIQEKSLSVTTKEWIVAYNWDESNWEGRLPITMQLLDKISPENPVYTIRVCGHLIVINSAAKRYLSNILENLPPEVRKGTNKGILKDIEIDKELYYPKSSKRILGIEAGCLEAARLGITTAHDFAPKLIIPFYFQAEKNERLLIRICLHYPPDFLSSLSKIGINSTFGSNKLRLGGVKLYYDGSIGARTALLSEPYMDAPEETGITLTSLNDISNYFKKAIESNIQPIIHVIGDQAIDDVLNELGKYKDDLSRLRARLEHVEMATEAHMDKSVRLGLIFSMQPNFCKWGLPGGLYEQRLGTKRLENMNAFASVHNKGINYTFGSDCMPLNPLLGIHFAVNHPVKKHRISVEEAFHAYSSSGAFCEFQENEKGTLSKNKLADFVILSQDPWENIERISDIEVELTVVGGKIIYNNPNGSFRLANK